MSKKVEGCPFSTQEGTCWPLQTRQFCASLNCVTILYMQFNCDTFIDTLERVNCDRQSSNNTSLARENIFLGPLLFRYSTQRRDIGERSIFFQRTLDQFNRCFIHG